MIQDRQELQQTLRVLTDLQSNLGTLTLDRRKRRDQP